MSQLNGEKTFEALEKYRDNCDKIFRTVYTDLCQHHWQHLDSAINILRFEYQQEFKRALHDFHPSHKTMWNKMCERSALHKLHRSQ